MPAYFFVDIREIKDEAKMERYRAEVSPVVEKFGGRYLVVGGPVSHPPPDIPLASPSLPLLI